MTEGELRALAERLKAIAGAQHPDGYSIFALRDHLSAAADALARIAKEKAELESRVDRLLRLLEEARKEGEEYKRNWAAAYTSEGVYKGRAQIAEGDAARYCSEVAEMADEIAFWKFQAMFLRAHNTNRDINRPKDWHAIEAEFLQAMAEENASRQSGG